MEVEPKCHLGTAHLKEIKIWKTEAAN
jgi:hypothetical protein